MNPLHARAEDYLAMRRSLGYKLRRDGRLLLDFTDHLARAGQATITTRAAIEWATQPAGAAPSWWRIRLSVVRCFARYLQALDPACEIPPVGLLPATSTRITPYLYSPADIAALVHAAGTLAAPLKAATFQTLISLLAVTGMRVGEAAALGRSDVDLEAGLLTVTGKYGKVRLVPLHPTTTGMLRGYAIRRDQLCPEPASRAFFITTAGTRLRVPKIDETFATLLALAGVEAPGRHRRPRIHDLRHTFAVATYLRWHKEGTDVQASLPVLSTFLGHVSPASTWWYLQATPELLALAAERLEPLKEES